jgi:hypothetical protein
VGSAGAIGQCLVLRMDGVGVKGDENVLSAGGRRLVLRLFRPDEDHQVLIGSFERERHNSWMGWILSSEILARWVLMFGRASGPRHRLLISELVGCIHTTLAARSSFSG